MFRESLDGAQNTETATHDFTNDFCFNCGGAEFIWGIVTGYSAALAVFKPDPETVVPAGFWSDSPTPTPEPLRARRCVGCGNVQLFALPPRAED